VTTFWLTLAKEGCYHPPPPPPPTVDGGDDVPIPSLRVGEVGPYGPLCLKRGLVVVQFGQLGFNGRSLTGEFTCHCATLRSASAC
jgi:hypothetical protein